MSLATLIQECTAAASPHAHADLAACAALGATLSPPSLAAHTATAPGVRFPLAFAGLEQEVNFLALLSLLRCGAGWAPILAAARAPETSPADLALRALFSLHLTGNKLDAEALVGLSEYGLAAAYGVDAKVDAPLVPGVSAITVAQDSPARPFLTALHRQLAETGRRLWELGVPSLGAFLLAKLPESSEQPPSGLALAEALRSALPAFADPFGCKALFLVGELARRFAGQRRFAFSDLHSLPPAADATLVAGLRHRGLLVVSDALAERIAAGTLLPSGSAEEVALRQAAVAAAAAVAGAVAGGVSSQVAGRWLGQGGIEHLTQDTIAY